MLGRAAGFDVSGLERDAFRTKVESSAEGSPVVRIAGRDGCGDVFRSMWKSGQHTHVERATLFGVYAFLENVPQDVVIWDYEADAYRNTNFTEWDVVGKRPYTFGIFMAYEAGLDPRTDYARVLERQRALVTAELTTTSQRVNLFEKVKIPACKENIRVIKIAIGDEQTAAVTRGKIAKSRVPETTSDGEVAA